MPLKGPPRGGVAGTLLQDELAMLRVPRLFGGAAGRNMGDTTPSSIPASIQCERPFPRLIKLQ